MSPYLMQEEKDEEEMIFRLEEALSLSWYKNCCLLVFVSAVVGVKSAILSPLSILGQNPFSMEGGFDNLPNRIVK